MKVAALRRSPLGYGLLLPAARRTDGVVGAAREHRPRGSRRTSPRCCAGSAQWISPTWRPDCHASPNRSRIVWGLADRASPLRWAAGSRHCSPTRRWSRCPTPARSSHSTRPRRSSGTSTITAFGNSAARRRPRAGVKQTVSKAPHERDRFGERGNRVVTSVRSSAPMPRTSVARSAAIRRWCEWAVPRKPSGRGCESAQQSVTQGGTPQGCRDHQLGHQRGLTWCPHQREHRVERERRELVERVAVGQDEAADPLRMGVDQELAQAAACVVADQRHVVEVQRGQEVVQQIRDRDRGQVALRSFTGMLCEPSGSWL